MAFAGFRLIMPADGLRATGASMENTRAIIEADQKHLIHPLHYAKENEQPLVIVKAKGELLIDAEGKEYIDGLSCLWNVNIGHGRKELADAAAAQMSVLDF